MNAASSSCARDSIRLSLPGRPEALSSAHAHIKGDKVDVLGVGGVEKHGKKTETFARILRMFLTVETALYGKCYTTKASRQSHSHRMPAVATI